MRRVAVIYHMWPHYREAVALAMDRSERIAYTFYGSGAPHDGIEHLDPSRLRRFVTAPFGYKWGAMWQPEAVRAARSSNYDAIIYLGDPHFASTWVGAAIAKMRGTPILFWAHGWLRPERAATKALRRTFFALADKVMVYADRGKQLGIKAGYPVERIKVVYNSLDVAKADRIIDRIESGSLVSYHPQALFDEPERPLIVCTARLTEKCRFDLLLDAAKLLAERGRPINILLIGDGPARSELEAQAARDGLSVHFFGACYDEDVTGQLIYHADITVSPGKIGLTAMHSLMYGTPAITHDDLDNQMPEVEAITPGETGAFFRRDDAHDLGDTIDEWLLNAPDRAQVRSRARAATHGKWNPVMQAKLIEEAVMEAIERA